MTATRRAYLRAQADRLIAEGDLVSARMILDLVAYAERYDVR